MAGGTAALDAEVVRPIESRAEVDSLGDLQQRRRALLAQLAPLKALHGHNGLWDNKRKQMLEAIKVRVRMTLEADGKKGTDAAVDALAHADEQYARFIDAGITDRIDYLTLQNEADEIAERIRSREIELLAYNGELKLAR